VHFHLRHHLYALMNHWQRSRRLQPLQPSLLLPSQHPSPRQQQQQAQPRRRRQRAKLLTESQRQQS
jgi:hypothetical protein